MLVDVGGGQGSDQRVRSTSSRKCHHPYSKGHSSSSPIKITLSRDGVEANFRTLPTAERSLEVEIKSFSTHHIEALIFEGGGTPWRFISFYGHHETGNLNDCGMIDIGYMGFAYTWCNIFISRNSTKARLDRCLSSKGWRDRFPNANLHHLTSNSSDHLPLFLKLRAQSQQNLIYKSRFKFEGRWCLYEESKEIVQAAWDKKRVLDPGIQVLESIRNSRLGLLEWKRTTLGHVQNTIQDKQDQLDALQQGIVANASKGQACILAKDIDRLREADDIYWCQRSRALWRVKRDRNTPSFHALSAHGGGGGDQSDNIN
ncbi:hypothetical protein LIER_34086 [Lithospermum erythrorhizon]|uniref:Endonuclease/exonuclease/phosphatase n=1 Tax=Lithospermum erythrorhizon TaxID=34254 RepID=A0AAV3RYN2_LITER